MTNRINRRNFAKYAGLLGSAGLAGCTGGGGGDGDDGGTTKTPGGDGGTTPTEGDGGDGMASGERPVKWIGPPSLTADQQGQKYSEVSGIDIETTRGTLTGVVQQVLTGANETHDAMANSAHVGSAVTLANPTTVPIPVDDLDYWQEGKISDIFLDPSKGLPALGEQAKRLAAHIYADPENKEELLMPPQVFNLDALAINPAEVSRDTNEWSALFDDQFAGSSILCDISFIGGLEAMMHLKDNDMVDISLANLNNPSKDQIDQMIDFLVSEKEAGQFRTTWQAFGNSVNIFASGEATVGDLWQPAVYATRREGTPCIYTTHDSNTVQGEMFWYGGITPLAPGVNDRNNYDEVVSLIEDVHWSAWYPRYLGPQGYQAPNFVDTDLVRDGSDDTGEGMGPEFYDWAYEGKATYESVDNPDLFDPGAYEWSDEEGSPNSEGQVRDGGPIQDRLDRTTSMWIFPDNGSYLTQEWQRFRNA